jgi:hypothetical protein
MKSYLVQYGKNADLGRFTAESGEPLARGARVVIRGPRGVETGTVLCEPESRFQQSTADGEILRIADDAEHSLHQARAVAMLAEARTLAAEMALSFEPIDSEITLDGQGILHGLAWAACDAEPLLAELSRRYNLRIRLLDLGQPVAPREASTCGSGGCGSCGSCGSGGCSSTACVRGKVSSANELTAYFASLRRQMETDAQRVALA